MINIKVTNCRRAKTASFSLNPIALIAGENENGKSSIALAVALAATQNALPKSVAKKDAKVLVHSDCDSGMVQLEKDGVVSEISWPRAEFTQKGQGKPIFASEFAAGMKNIFQLPPVERTAFFIDLLHAKPSKKDLTRDLPRSITAPEIDKLWEKIEATGWDEAHQAAKKDEDELTGQWKRITKETRWNVNTAGKWRPQSWEPELERAEREELEVDFANANKAYEDALKMEGAQAFDRSQAEALVAKKGEYAEAVTSLEGELQLAEVRSRDLTAQLGALGSPGHDPMECPDCGAKLTLKPRADLLGQHQLVKAETLSPEAQAEHARVSKEVHDSTVAVTGLRDKLAQARHQLETALEAQKRLETASDPATIAETGLKKEARDAAERRLDAFNVCREAYSVYEQIITQKDLVKALSQDGTRKRKLDDQIDSFNKEVLKPLSDQLGCDAVFMDNELAIFRGKYPYGMLSRSAQYAVRTLLQVAIAKADRSELLVVDDLDAITSRKGRAGVMNMVVGSGIPTLICMAKKPEDRTPDLAELKIGHSYVIEDGVLRDYAAPAQEAQVA